MSETCFEVVAIRYATVTRTRQSNFLRPVEGAIDAPMPLDFFIWLVRGPGGAVLVDTGFNAVSALTRNREFLLPPADCLQRLGHPAGSIEDVVLTHLHYDHAGNVRQFPNARIWVQGREVRYATGDCMCDPKLNHFFSTADIHALIERVFEGDVRQVDGSHSLRDGIELHHVGGHTDGLQVVRVRTRKGWVVLASDAAHYYENFATNNPFPAIYSLDDMLAGYARIRELADSDDHIVPGHDPEVRRLFPSMHIAGVDAFLIA